MIRTDRRHGTRAIVGKWRRIKAGAGKHANMEASNESGNPASMEAAGTLHRRLENPEPVKPWSLS